MSESLNLVYGTGTKDHFLPVSAEKIYSTHLVDGAEILNACRNIE